MKISLVVFFFILISTSSTAQFNLVPNPSFEVYDICPWINGQITFAVPWSTPIHTSTDYFNSCDTNTNPNNSASVPLNFGGFEYARTGQAYANIATYRNSHIPIGNNNYREYLSAPLLDSLVSGIEYCVRFYVSADDSAGYTSPTIGVYFGPIRPDTNIYPISVQPQIENPSSNLLNSRNGWSLVSGSFIAAGNEKWIVIGNFHDSLNTQATYTGRTINPLKYFAAYYVNDVLLTPCDALLALDNLVNPEKVTVFNRNGALIIKSDGDLLKGRILNILGAELKKFDLRNKTENEVEIQNLSNGIYLIEVVTHQSQYCLKFLKSN